MGDSVPKHTGPISLTDTHLEPNVDSFCPQNTPTPKCEYNATRNWEYSTVNVEPPIHFHRLKNALTHRRTQSAFNGRIESAISASRRISVQTIRPRWVRL